MNVTREGTAPLLDAVQWIQLLLTGRTASVVATLAIATIGFMMFSGRIPVTRGATVILGCFVLFAAGLIGEALTTAMQPSMPPAEVAPAPMVQGPSPAVAPPTPYDPYAGASVPNRSAEPHDLLQN